MTDVIIPLAMSCVLYFYYTSYTVTVHVPAGIMLQAFALTIVVAGRSGDMHSFDIWFQLSICNGCCRRAGVPFLTLGSVPLWGLRILQLLRPAFRTCSVFSQLSWVCFGNI